MHVLGFAGKGPFGGRLPTVELVLPGDPPVLDSTGLPSTVQDAPFWPGICMNWNHLWVIFG